MFVLSLRITQGELEAFVLQKSTLLYCPCHVLFLVALLKSCQPVSHSETCSNKLPSQGQRALLLGLELE